MSSSKASPSTTTDAFARFWHDMASTAVDAAQSGQQISGELLQQMRRAFVESLGKYTDEYLRSSQFTQMMQNAMAQALVFASISILSFFVPFGLPK